jgi:hypothetical protein
MVHLDLDLYLNVLHTQPQKGAAQGTVYSQGNPSTQPQFIVEGEAPDLGGGCPLASYQLIRFPLNISTRRFKW